MGPMGPMGLMDSVCPMGPMCLSCGLYNSVGLVGQFQVVIGPEPANCQGEELRVAGPLGHGVLQPGAEFVGALDRPLLHGSAWRCSDAKCNARGSGL